jgi:DNA-binding MarR family transcriptional regulator
MGSLDKINDMDTLSAADLARELNTSVPRVTRAAARLDLKARQSNGRFAFDRRAAGRIRDALGVTPRAAGLSNSELAVLSALRSAPFGLESARAVARRADLSPTTARRTLEALARSGLVERTAETVAVGRARDANIWRANIRHPRWASLDPILSQVERPAAPRDARRGERQVPARLRHLFWNSAESQLDASRAGPYIARRLLRTMDLQGLAWGVDALTPEDWERAAQARGLATDVRRLAHNLAAATRKGAGTLKGVFGATKVEFFDASELELLAKPTDVAGLQVASPQDLMAMKLKVMAERGEMRDYFDVKAIDEQGTVSVEEGVALYMRRYGIDPSSEALPHLYRTMGDLSDVEVDELLPIDLAELQRWWSGRQARALRNADRFG